MTTVNTGTRVYKAVYAKVKKIGRRKGDKSMTSIYTKAVDKYRERIIEAHNYIWAHPETGYRE